MSSGSRPHKHTKSNKNSEQPEYRLGLHKRNSDEPPSSPKKKERVSYLVSEEYIYTFIFLNDYIFFQQQLGEIREWIQILREYSEGKNNSRRHTLIRRVFGLILGLRARDSHIHAMGVGLEAKKKKVNRNSRDTQRYNYIVNTVVKL